MRTQILTSLALLPVLAACDGALGGNIHDEKSELTNDDLTTEVSLIPRSSAPAQAPDPVVPDPVDDEPKEVPATGNPEKPEKEKPVKTSAPPPPSGPLKLAVLDAGSAAAGTAGKITGTVSFTGDAPKRIPLTKIAETQGCQAHLEAPLTEDWIVNDGKLANLFIFLTDIPSDVTVPAAPTEPAVLDQVGCVYVPHVLGVQVGQQLTVLNSDDAAHNVRAGGKRYDGGSRAMGAGSAPLTMPVPESEEFPIDFQCDLHPWMKAKVCVVEHPWFAVSAEDGSFSIEGIPPGTYGIQAWHEKAGKVKTKGDLTIGPGGHVQADFTISPAKKGGRGR